MSSHATDIAYNWSGYQLGRNVRVSLGDVDGDNRLEVLATCCGEGANSGTLYLYDWNGTAFVEKARTSLGRIVNIRVIKCGRITGGLGDDLVIGTDNYFFIYQAADHQLRRIYQSPYLGGPIVDIEIRDITGDGRPEVIVAIEGVGVRVYRWTGGQLILLFEIKITVRIRISVGFTSGSSVPELVVLQTGRGAGRDIVEIYRVENMQLVLSHSIQLDVIAAGPIRVGNLNGGAAEEIIIATDSGRRVLVLGWLNNSYSRIALSDSFDSPVRELAVGDWDNGRHNELVVGTANGILVYRLENNRLVFLETVETPYPLMGMRMADLNASGRQEIVIGTERGTVHFCRKIVEVVVRPRPPVVILPKPTPIVEPKAQFLVSERVTIPENFPDVITVASVKARPKVTRVNVITNKVIVTGFFEVDILVVVEPDRRVLSFSTRIPFTHFVHIPGLTTRHRVRADVEVEYVDYRFDPRFPRQIEVIIVAEIFIFDYVVRYGETLAGLADRWQTEIDVIVNINQLASREISAGQRLKAPMDMEMV